MNFCNFCSNEAEQLHHISYKEDILIPICIKCHYLLHNHGVGSPNGHQNNTQNREFKTWIIKVPKYLNNAILEELKLGTHITRSEFIRQAVREKMIKKLGKKVIDEGLEESRNSD